jgi:hypothetical protein
VTALAGLPRDYRDMIAFLVEEGADFVVVGGWAVGVHGHIRATKDLDLFVRPSAANAPCVLRALARFGAPIHGLVAADLSTPGVILQVGVSLRIDITTTIEGVDFDEASASQVIVVVNGLQVPVIGRAALLINKRSAGRPQDLIDVNKLEAVAQQTQR